MKYFYVVYECVSGYQGACIVKQARDSGLAISDCYRYLIKQHREGLRLTWWNETTPEEYAKFIKFGQELIQRANRPQPEKEMAPVLLQHGAIPMFESDYCSKCELPVARCSCATIQQ